MFYGIYIHGSGLHPRARACMFHGLMLYLLRIYPIVYHGILQILASKMNHYDIVEF